MAKTLLRYKDLKDQFGTPYPRPFLHCPECSERFSANGPDYFMRDPEARIEHCGVPMKLVTARTVLTEVSEARKMETVETPLTDVIFRKWPKSEGGDVLALFPNDPGTDDAYTCSSYQHIGQHSSADPNVCIARTTPASETEYASLKRELESNPYNYRLRVVRRHTQRHLKARRAEIDQWKIPKRPE